MSISQKIMLIFLLFPMNASWGMDKAYDNKEIKTVVDFNDDLRQLHWKIYEKTSSLIDSAIDFYLHEKKDKEIDTFLFNASTPVKKTVMMHNGYVYFAACNQSNDKIITVSKDLTAVVWDFEGNRLLTIEHGDSSVCMGYFIEGSTGSEKIALQSKHGTIDYYNLKGKRVSTVSGQHYQEPRLEGGLRFLKRDEDEKTLLYIPSNNREMVFAQHRIEIPGAFKSYPRRTFFVSHNGERINYAWLCRFENRNQRGELIEDKENARYLLTCSDDGTAVLWDFAGDKKALLRRDIEFIKMLDHRGIKGLFDERPLRGSISRAGMGGLEGLFTWCKGILKKGSGDTLSSKFSRFGEYSVMDRNSPLLSYVREFMNAGKEVYRGDWESGGGGVSYAKAFKTGDSNKVLLTFLELLLEALDPKGDPAVEKESAAISVKQLFNAIDRSDLAYITKYVRSNTVLPNVTNEEGLTLLHYACLKGALDIVKFLVQRNSKLLLDLNNTDTYEGWSALDFALFGKHSHIAKYLIDAGCTTIHQMQANLGRLNKDDGCCICFASIKTRYAGLPCGHAKVCGCNKPPACPECRAPIERWLQIYI